MNALIFPDLKSCAALQASVDASLGYPAPGKDIGRGRHTPPSQSVTVSYIAPVDLLDGTFAYPVDAVNAPALPANDAGKAVAVSANLLPAEPAPPSVVVKPPGKLPPQPVGPPVPVAVPVDVSSVAVEVTASPVLK